MASPFENMTFLFTGKLKNMERDDAEAKVAALGRKVASGVSKNLSVLVATRRFNISAADQPNLSKVKSLVRMFNCAESLNAPLEK
ncbi:MAG: BRCT domain-containing protein [Proteobacteria bacterium]|nr:BRCT domain-containing protein [Pseudomonadota bacterium]